MHRSGLPLLVFGIAGLIIAVAICLFGDKIGAPLFGVSVRGIPTLLIVALIGFGGLYLAVLGLVRVIRDRPNDLD
jgi:hypothetical protein